MSATSMNTSSSSPSSAVAGQQTSAALKALDDFQEISFSISLEQMRHMELQYDGSSSPPETPSLVWDSRPSSAELPNSSVQSVFEDWQDEVVTTLSVPVIIEEDGAQTLLISVDSPFFLPPSPKKPFGFAPFSNDHADISSDHEININKTMDSQEDRDENAVNSKGLILLVDTSVHTTFGNSVMLLSSSFSTPAPRVVDDASWAPKDFMQGPDVPLDCIYSAGDVSPMVEHWGEETWSPIRVRPFRSAPCA